MTPKEINDLKKQHNVLLEQGQQVYARAVELHDQCLALQKRIQKAEGDEYDAIPLIFGAGFWIDPEL